MTVLNQCILYLAGDFLDQLPALQALDLGSNQLVEFVLPEPLAASLADIDVSNNRLQQLSLPAGAVSLTRLAAGGNGLTEVVLPGELPSLVELSLWGNQLSDLTLPQGLGALVTLVASAALVAAIGRLLGRERIVLAH